MAHVLGELIAVELTIDPCPEFGKPKLTGHNERLPQQIRDTDPRVQGIGSKPTAG